MPRTAVAAAAVGLAGLLACRDPWAPPPGITGTWAADIHPNTLIAISVRDDDGAISGTGFVAILTVAGNTGLTVRGQRVNAALTLHMDETTGGSMTFTGTARGETLVGVLHGLRPDSIRTTFELR